MPKYYKKVPFFLRWIYSKAVWSIDTSEKTLYLTFDDGPTEEVTDFVLNELDKYNAKATFFCLGYNAENNLNIVDRIKESGHAIGNHSFSHPNGFRTKTNTYLNDVEKADVILETKLFRPPYGKLKLKQYKYLNEKFDVIMWDVMSGDFDDSIDAHQCYTNVISNAQEGSIIVFHDSNQSFPRLKYALPNVLKYYSDLGFRFEKLI